MAVLGCILCLLDCIPEDLACPLDALLIGVGVHPQCDGFVAVPQLFRHAGNVGTIGNGNTGEAVAELMWMQSADPVPFGEFFEVMGGTLRVHRFWAALLGKYKFAQNAAGLLLAELPQETNYLRIYIYCP